MSSLHSPLYTLQTSLLFITSPLLLLPLLITLTTLFYTIRHFVEQRRNPPGPPRLPIIGNLHQLGSLPHRSLQRLANTYGPLLLLKFGQIPTLIVTSPSLAKQVLKTDDFTWCVRPALTVNQKLSCGGLDVAFNTDFNEWQQLRKLTNLEFYKSKRVLSSMQSAREREVDTMMENIAQASEKGEAINLSDMLLGLLANLTCMVAFGKRFSSQEEFEKSELGATVTEAMKMLGVFMVGDFFPGMKYVVNVLFGEQRRIERVCKRVDEVLEKELKEKEEEGMSNGDDFTSVLLRLHKDASLGGALTRDHVKAILMVTNI